jgi:hypothetical protein
MKTEGCKRIYPPRENNVKLVPEHDRARHHSISKQATKNAKRLRAHPLADIVDRPCRNRNGGIQELGCARWTLNC